jgi:uncharacterized membrane protein
MENTEQPPSTLTRDPSPADDGRTVAIVSYFSILGWIIALVIHTNNKTSLGVYHLRQTVALFVVAIGTGIVQMLLVFIPYIGWALDILLMFVYFGLFVLWIIGLIAAINGQKKPMPFIGKNAQRWFSGIK